MRVTTLFVLTFVLSACGGSAPASSATPVASRAGGVRVVDARDPEEAEAARLWDRGVFGQMKDCGYGIRRIADEDSSPARLDYLAARLDRDLQGALDGELVRVEQFTLYHNEHDARTASLVAARGTGDGTLLGAAVAAVGERKSFDRLQEFESTNPCSGKPGYVRPEERPEGNAAPQYFISEIRLQLGQGSKPLAARVVRVADFAELSRQERRTPKSLHAAMAPQRFKALEQVVDSIVAQIQSQRHREAQLSIATEARAAAPEASVSSFGGETPQGSDTPSAPQPKAQPAAEAELDASTEASSASDAAAGSPRTEPAPVSAAVEPGRAPTAR